MKGPDVVEHTQGRTQPDLRAGLERIATSVRDAQRLSAQSEPGVLGLFERFGTFLDRAFDVEHLSEVSAEHVDAFVRAAGAGALVAPSVATMRLRRSALRLLFRTARELDLVEGDPTLDLVLPSRTNESARPLTDDEVARCRSASLPDLTSTRLATAWALGEASARTAEIPHICLADLNRAGGRVWIHGSSNTEARWGALTEWGRGQVDRRARELRDGGGADALLAYQGSGTQESRRSYSSQALRETLERAGLASDRHVRPSSLAAWAGVQVMRETGRVDAVARALGMRSLDAATRMIGWDWTNVSDCDD